MSNNYSNSNKVISSLKSILGNGKNEKEYRIISADNLTFITLNKVLDKNDPDDFDKDGINDWDEVNTNLIYAMHAKDNSNFPSRI